MNTPQGKVWTAGMGPGFDSRTETNGSECDPGETPFGAALGPCLSHSLEEGREGEGEGRQGNTIKLENEGELCPDGHAQALQLPPDYADGGGGGGGQKHHEFLTAGQIIQNFARPSVRRGTVLARLQGNGEKCRAFVAQGEERRERKASLKGRMRR